MSESPEQEEYVVEAIRGWRFHLRKQRMQYFIKWQNYGEHENTWEPLDNLNCPHILADYEKGMSEKEKRYYAYEPKKKLSGFQRNATFDNCVGADEGHKSDDKYAFYVLVTFEDSDFAEEVTLEEYHEYEPRRALEFVEQRLLWKKQPLNNIKKDKKTKKKKKRVLMEEDDSP